MAAESTDLFARPGANPGLAARAFELHLMVYRRVPPPLFFKELLRIARSGGVSALEQNPCRAARGVGHPVSGQHAGDLVDPLGLIQGNDA